MKKTPEYQVLARKYRPQQFQEVVGQEPIVATLLNALELKKTAHAYLFCGSRGTGKTTLARILAKALNCENPEKNREPCNKCTSCIEIAGGFSMDVLEIDGASHRGIEDIRQINETIAFAPTTGKYKIYLIDEVHMLTKEAFNALLKTLEEPPSRVKFFFATTEPHKLPSTIISRCQRFNLRRIPTEKIEKKLDSILTELKRKADPEALHLIARLAEGGLRDAESLLDQVLAYCDTELSYEKVSEALGIISKEKLFDFDKAVSKGDYNAAFTLAREVFSSGTNISYFIDELILHFRALLLLKSGAPCDLPKEARERYQLSLPLYTQMQCLDILEMLSNAHQEIKFAASEKVALEMLLLKILRTHQKISFETLVARLNELEKMFAPSPSDKLVHPTPETPRPNKAPSLESKAPFPLIMEDPSPRPEELPATRKTEEKKSFKTQKPQENSPPKQQEAPPQNTPESLRQQSKVETLLRFAAKELDGALKKDPSGG